MNPPWRYNPAFFAEHELIEQFAIHHAELAELRRVVAENTGASNQHALVIGPRGSGKTTLLLRLVAEIHRDRALNARWLPIVLPEELYLVGTLGELWLEALHRLALQSREERLAENVRRLRAERDEHRLRALALGQLFEEARRQHKRLLLVVENLDQLLGEQLGDDDAWALRQVLQNEPDLMLLGSAPTLFKEIQRPDRALYEHFKLLRLDNLDLPACTKLWEAVTGRPTIERRVRPVQILTGGNPRMLTILASFARETSTAHLLLNLTRFIDEQTDAFKASVEALATQERRVYTALADLWQPSTAHEVAERARVEVNTASALLTRLEKKGRVEVVMFTGGRKRYLITERLFNIYWLLRQSSDTAERVRALVRFMVHFYDLDELLPGTFSSISGLAPPLALALQGGWDEALASLRSSMDNPSHPVFEPPLTSLCILALAEGRAHEVLPLVAEHPLAHTQGAPLLLALKHDPAELALAPPELQQAAQDILSRAEEVRQRGPAGILYGQAVATVTKAWTGGS